MPKLSRLFIAFFILSLTAIIHADDVIIGKVVGVADGDTGFWGRNYGDRDEFMQFLLRIRNSNSAISFLPA